MTAVKGLRERVRDGETILCAEGYLWELGRRGFVKFGNFTPEVVLEFPERVKALHEEFVLAGSDVVEAYTYYGHSEKMGMIGRAGDTESINRKSLQMAKEVANRYGKLMAGNLSNTTVFEPDNEEIANHVTAMFKEQVEWAVDEGADYIIGETFNDFQEAKLALEAIQKYGKGVPSVITLAAYSPDQTTDDIPIEEALRRLEELGADVVGLNCSRGPATMIPLLKKVRKTCKGPLAALPVPIRTNDKEITFQAVKDPTTGEHLYPSNLGRALCNGEEIQKFTKEALEIGIQYMGLCCTNDPSLFREMAMACGRTPVLAKFHHDITTSMLYGKIASQHKVKLRNFMMGDTDGVYT